MIRAEDRALAADLLAGFMASGAEQVEVPILQPAGALLDLYGEDIRARAFVTRDTLGEEAMLRPDFTVPVVETHVRAGGGTARYCYSGEVFRRQEGDPHRPREYLQVGHEAFGGDDPADADAEAFDLVARALAPWGAMPATGDLGLLIAAVEGLGASEARRGALRRHIWRPARFRRLLARFAAPSRPAPARSALLEAVAARGARAVAAEAGPAIGLRTADEIEARLDALAVDAREPSIPAGEVAVIDRLLALDGSMAAAAAPLREMARAVPALLPAIKRVEARADALARLGHDPAALPFAPAHHRMAMEYYDGFVFTLAAPATGGATLATGGRYDALTRVLGGGRAIPAVGAVIRPGLLRGLERRS